MNQKHTNKTKRNKYKKTVMMNRKFKLFQDETQKIKISNKKKMKKRKMKRRKMKMNFDLLIIMWILSLNVIINDICKFNMFGVWGLGFGVMDYAFGPSGTELDFLLDAAASAGA